MRQTSTDTPFRRGRLPRQSVPRPDRQAVGPRVRDYSVGASVHALTADGNPVFARRRPLRVEDEQNQIELGVHHRASLSLTR